MLENINRLKLQEAIEKFSSANVLVIGDIIVDHFIWGNVSRISPEAPVPVVNVTDESLLLGGSANVLHNLYDLGARATLCGVIGYDLMGQHLLQLLQQMDSPTAGVIKTHDRPTTKKTRIVAQSQQVVRFDREKTDPLPAETLHAQCSFIEANIASFDAVIISDYCKGVVCGRLMDHLRRLVSRHHVPMIVDPKPSHATLFKGATIITPNHREAEKMSGVTICDDESLFQAAAALLQRLDSTAVLITRGEAGMTLLEKEKPIFTIPTVAKEIYDVTGAGDTVIASLALGLASGLSFAEAATLANFAAGIVVAKIGTATASAKELMELIS